MLGVGISCHKKCVIMHLSHCNKPILFMGGEVCGLGPGVGAGFVRRGRAPPKTKKTKKTGSTCIAPESRFRPNAGAQKPRPIKIELAKQPQKSFFNSAG